MICSLQIDHTMAFDQILLVQALDAPQVVLELFSPARFDFLGSLRYPLCTGDTTNSEVFSVHSVVQWFHFPGP